LKKTLLNKLLQKLQTAATDQNNTTFVKNNTS